MRTEKHMPKKKLDHAAILFMANKRRDWSQAFRISMSLREEIDPVALQRALEAVAPRFPYLFSSVHSGRYWYYLQPVDTVLPPAPDTPSPLTFMPSGEIKKQAIRILYGKYTITVEPFHALTDGQGCLIFLKTLVAEYITQRYGTPIPRTHGIKRLEDGPQPEDYEDSFLHHTHSTAPRENVSPAFVPLFEKTASTEVSTGIFDVDELLETARACGVTLTTLFTAAMMDALQQVQAHQVPRRRRWKPVRIVIPVDVRKLFDSQTLHNFTMYATAGADPRTAQYDFEELLRLVQVQIDVQRKADAISAMIGSNVKLEQHPVAQRMPLPLKMLGVKAGAYLYGDRKFSLCFSNLGVVQLPPEMSPYIERVDFMLQPKVDALYNCASISFGGKLYFNITRNTHDTELAELFFENLAALGLTIQHEHSGVLGQVEEELMREPLLA